MHLHHGLLHASNPISIILIHASVRGPRDNLNCECGQIQSMLHIVEHCPLTKLTGGLKSLNTACTEAVAWLDQGRVR